MFRLGLVITLALAAGCTRSFIEDYSRVEIHRDLVYAEVDDRPLRVDLYLPRERDSGSPPPIILWMHGGSWLFGTHHDCRIDWLAEEGYAVASVAYRTSLEAKWPAQLDDARAAVRWVRANAGTYGYSAERVAAAGMSSGGHVALMLGLDRSAGEESCVDAVLDYYGPTDLQAMSRDWVFSDWPGFPVRQLLGKSVRSDPDRAINASPYYRIRPKAPPVLLIHGEDDFVVPAAQSERFHEAYREANLDSQLVMVADAGHYGGSRYFGRDGPREQVLEFLRRTLAKPASMLDAKVPPAVESFHATAR
jgi:acetyl esterase/lipase